MPEKRGSNQTIEWKTKVITNLTMLNVPEKVLQSDGREQWHFSFIIKCSFFLASPINLCWYNSAVRHIGKYMYHS